MESVRSEQKEEADWAVGYAIVGLKIEIIRDLDQEVATFKTRLEAKMNEARHATTTRLQKIKDLVAVVHGSQQKWGGY